MSRDLTRTRAQVPDDGEDTTRSGLDEFKTRERVTKEVDNIPDFIKPGFAVGTRSSASGPKVSNFKIEKFDEEVLIKFLEPVSFAPIFQHWIPDSAGKRKVYTCITTKNGCPLCARGDVPKSSDWFNIVDMSGSEPELKVWYASPSPASAIKQRAENKRTSPIDRSGLYFVAYKVNTKNDIPEYHIDPVREDELETWGAVPLTDEQLNNFKAQMHDASLVKVHSKVELEEVARNSLD